MEKRTNYYISAKNPLTWLVALCMVCSAVARILFVDVKGVDTWSQIVLPIVAALLYALNILISGKEYFYKSAISVWMISIYYSIVLWQHDFQHYDKMIGVLFIIVMLFIAIMYTQITAGKRAAAWLLLLTNLFPLAAVAYINRETLLAGQYRFILPDALMTLGLLIIVS